MSDSSDDTADSDEGAADTDVDTAADNGSGDGGSTDGRSADNGSGDGGSATEETGAGVDAAEVEHVAELARVDLDAEEIDAFTEQFGDILEYFATLDEVPEVEREAELVNVMRPDEVEDGLSQEEALQNAPESEDGFFKGPKVS